MSVIEEAALAATSLLKRIRRLSEDPEGCSAEIETLANAVDSVGAFVDRFSRGVRHGGNSNHEIQQQLAEMKSMLKQLHSSHEQEQERI
jgi:uncharacterized protein YoxC